MQNDNAVYMDEVEPRSIPKPAPKFDSRPIPVVPELSLIMEREQQNKKLDSPSIERISTLKSNSAGHSPYRAGESYAAWKENKYLHHSRSPNHYPIHSSTRNSSTLQNTHSYNYPPKKSCNSSNCRNYNCKHEGSDDESPKRYNYSGSLSNEPIGRYDNMKYSRDTTPQRYSTLRDSREHSPRRHEYYSRNVHFENSNKHATNYATNQNGIDCQVNNVNGYNLKSHVRDGRISPDRRHSDHLLQSNIEMYDTKQTSNIHRSVSCPNTHDYRAVSQEYDHDTRYSKALQPVYHSPEQAHPHSRIGCCSANYNNLNSETETVKNLLQIITSQNEQIKHLQKQVERLLKLHEQTLKDKKHCTCQPNGAVYQNQNQQLYEQSHSNNLPITQGNGLKDIERYHSDVKMQDEKNKQAILEQKVSIGVMTSFELKLQNNPSLVKTNEEKQKNHQDKVLSNIGTSNIIKSLVNDTGEMIRKKKSNFLPSLALENISEASESHISSLRQSHPNADSTRQSMEAQDSIEMQIANFHREHSKENGKVHFNPKSKRSKMSASDNRTRNVTNHNYIVEEPRYERPNSNIPEQPVYQYNYQYENERSSPQREIEEKRADDYKNDEPVITDIIKMKNTKSEHLADDCLSLSSSDLDVEDPSPPSPEPSIHLDMQEFSDEGGGSLPPQQAKVGWTLYNNVLDQVNQILQNSDPLNGDCEEEPLDIRNHQIREYDNNAIMDTVKAATLEQLKNLGISISDNVDQREPQYNKKVFFDASCYQRQGHDTHLATASGSIETNTSMHMKALAMKYLNDDQLSELKSRPGIMKQGSAGIQNTNMSFATMHYLQRYHLLPGNGSPKREAPREDYRPQVPMTNERIQMKTAERRVPSPQRYPPFTGSSKVSYPSKILDISTLKQQPKLL